MQRMTAGKRFRLPNRRIPPQVQRPMGTFDCLTLLVPPRDQFENGGQISIDCIPAMAGLYGFPLILESQQAWPSSRRWKKGSCPVHG